LRRSWNVGLEGESFAVVYDHRQTPNHAAITTREKGLFTMHFGYKTMPDIMIVKI
jgi:hypothetical protein